MLAWEQKLLSIHILPIVGVAPTCLSHTPCCVTGDDYVRRARFVTRAPPAASSAAVDVQLRILFCSQRHVPTTPVSTRYQRRHQQSSTATSTYTSQKPAPIMGIIRDDVNIHLPIYCSGHAGHAVCSPSDCYPSCSATEGAATSAAIVAAAVAAAVVVGEAQPGTIVGTKTEASTTKRRKGNKLR